MAIVNFRMLSHPLNWLTVLLMALIAGAFGHYVLAWLGFEPAKPGSEQRTSAWASMPAGQAPGEERAGAINPQMASIAINSVQ